MSNQSKGFARVEIFEEYCIVPTAGGFKTCTTPEELWRAVRGEVEPRKASTSPIPVRHFATKTETVEDYKARGGKVLNPKTISLDDLDL